MRPSPTPLHSIKFACLLLLIATCSASAGSLAGKEDRETNVVPKSVAGLKMKYKDLHGSYVCSFSSDGTYSFSSQRANEQPEIRTGKYQWQVKGNRIAFLSLSEDEVYTLTFESQTKASGKVKDDVRTYYFTFGP